MFVIPDFSTMGKEKQAFADTWTLAYSGNADAQLYVGNCYLSGVGVEQNYAEAYKWFEKAASQGHVMAEIALGRMYQNGYGVPMNMDNALLCFKRAASKSESLETWAALFEFYLCADNKYKNFEEALKWVDKFFLNFIEFKNYEKIVINVFNVIKKNGFSVYTLNTYANRGNNIALFLVGLYHILGVDSQPDPNKGIELLKRAVNMGNANAQFYLAYSYYQFSSVSENEEYVKHAFLLFKRSALNGNCAAQMILCEHRELFGDEEVSHELGFDEEILKKIDEWDLKFDDLSESLFESIENNDMLHYLVDSDEFDDVSDDTPKDLEDDYYTDGSYLFDSDVNNDESELKYLNKKLLDRDPETLGSLIEQGYYAKFQLGKCFYEGIEVDKDLERAYQLFKDALLEGSQEAKDFILEHTDLSSLFFNDSESVKQMLINEYVNDEYVETYMQGFREMMIGDICLFENNDFGSALFYYNEAEIKGVLRESDKFNYELSLRKGICYLKGDGIKNMQKAKECFEFAFSDSGYLQEIIDGVAQMDLDFNKFIQKSIDELSEDEDFPITMNPSRLQNVMKAQLSAFKEVLKFMNIKF